MVTHAVLSLHPRFEVDNDAGVILEQDNPTSSQLLDDDLEAEPTERTEFDLDVYADALKMTELAGSNIYEVDEEVKQSHL